jgi:hypothetical protein
MVHQGFEKQRKLLTYRELSVPSHPRASLMLECTRHLKGYHVKTINQFLCQNIKYYFGPVLTPKVPKSCYFDAFGPDFAISRAVGGNFQKH